MYSCSLLLRKYLVCDLETNQTARITLTLMVTPSAVLPYAGNILTFSASAVEAEGLYYDLGQSISEAYLEHQHHQSHHAAETSWMNLGCHAGLFVIWSCLLCTQHSFSPRTIFFAPKYPTWFRKHMINKAEEFKDEGQS